MFIVSKEILKEEGQILDKIEVYHHCCKFLKDAQQIEQVHKINQNEDVHM